MGVIPDKGQLDEEAVFTEQQQVEFPVTGASSLAFGENE